MRSESEVRHASNYVVRLWRLVTPARWVARIIGGIYFVLYLASAIFQAFGAIPTALDWMLLGVIGVGLVLAIIRTDIDELVGGLAFVGAEVVRALSGVGWKVPVRCRAARHRGRAVHRLRLVCPDTSAPSGERNSLKCGQYMSTRLGRLAARPALHMYCRNRLYMPSSTHERDKYHSVVSARVLR